MPFAGAAGRLGDAARCRLVGCPGARCKRTARLQRAHQRVVVESVAHEAAAAIGERCGCHVGHLGGRCGKAHITAAEAECGGVERLDLGALGALAGGERGVAGREAGLADGHHRGQGGAHHLVAALHHPAGDDGAALDGHRLAAGDLRPVQPGGDGRADLPGLAIERRHPAHHDVGATHGQDAGDQCVGRRPGVAAGEEAITQEHAAPGPSGDGVAQRTLRLRWPHGDGHHLVGHLHCRLDGVEVGGVGDRGRRGTVDGAVRMHTDAPDAQVGHLLDEHDGSHGSSVPPAGTPGQGTRPHAGRDPCDGPTRCHPAALVTLTR